MSSDVFPSLMQYSRVRSYLCLSNRNILKDILSGVSLPIALNFEIVIYHEKVHSSVAIMHDW